MRQTPQPSPAVVVGVDGSRGAVDAALWAIDEAIERGVPLRLVCAIEPSASAGTDSQAVAQAFATAEATVRYAAMAIESLDLPVKIEVEIVQDRPAAALLAAAHSAVMVCVGALGVNRATGKRMGSTLSALLTHARCPVAIVHRSGRPASDTGWVVTEFDTSPECSTVLGYAVDEALLRGAPLRVLTGQTVPANVERSLARWRALHPELDIQVVSVHGDPMDYLARHAASIQLIVLGHQPSEGLSHFAGPSPPTTLSCTVLVSARHSAL